MTAMMPSGSVPPPSERPWLDADLPVAERVELLLADVVSVEPSRSLGIVPNGLRIRHKGDAVEKFVVSERAGWLTALTRAR